MSPRKNSSNLGGRPVTKWVQSFVAPVECSTRAGSRQALDWIASPIWVLLGSGIDEGNQRHFCDLEVDSVYCSLPKQGSPTKDPQRLQTIS